MTETTSSPVPDPSVDNSHALISSARVEGTPVFNDGGVRLGTVHSLMIDKKSGQVAYAVMSFGGFLGIGARVHPIPWEKLTYQEREHGYCIDLSREQLEKAPTLRLDDADRPTDRAYDERMYEYYGATQYWGI